MAEMQWLKADVAGAAIGVDRENAIVLGYVVAQEGAFRREGRGEFDQKSLKGIVKLMKAEREGLKSRFGHPTLSDDGLGKFLGRVKNPRLDTVKVMRGGDKIELQAERADLHLSPTAFLVPAGNLGQYVLDLAANDPDALSSSLVLQTDMEYRLDARGRPELDEQGRELPPLWRPTQLHASDIVDTGDAVDGLLSVQLDYGLLPDAVLRRGVELLNQQFAGKSRQFIQDRCQAFLRRYLDIRFGAPPRTPLDTLRKRLMARGA